MTDKTGHPQPFKAIAVGIAAGLVASFAMDRFQAAVTALSSSEGGGEPATEKAADRVSVAVTGAVVPEADKGTAGQVVHYALGAALGGAYALAAEYRPVATAGYGTAFALVTAASLDEAAVPAVGLGKPPWQTPASTHAYTVASHLVFGIATEFGRRMLMGTAKKA